MRFSLSTLMILLAMGPPVLAGAWWAWPKVAETDKDRALADFNKVIELINSTMGPDTWDQLGGPGTITGFQTGCYVVVLDAEGNPDGPDPCGRNYSFMPYSPAEDDGFSASPATEPVLTPSPEQDPFR